MRLPREWRIHMSRTARAARAGLPEDDPVRLADRSA